jgi:hypothetical protein
MTGLEDRLRKPPPRTTVIAEVWDEMLTAMLTRPPAELGITHWSSRLLAEWLRRSGTRVSMTRSAGCGANSGSSPGGARDV